MTRERVSLSPRRAASALALVLLASSARAESLLAADASLIDSFVHAWVVPSIAVGLLLVGLVLFVWIARKRRNRALRRAELELARWDELLVHASNRLVKLRDDHPFLFGTRRLAARFLGETGEVYHRVGEAVDALFLGFSAAKVQRTRAQELHQRGATFSSSPYDAVLELLSSSEVEIGRESVTDTHLFLPESRTVTQTADQLLDLMQSSYQTVYEQVGALELGVTELPRVVQRATHALGQVDELCGALRRRSIPTDTFSARAEAIRAELSAVERDGATDPLGSRRQAEQVATWAEALRDRVQHMFRALEVLDDAVEQQLPAQRERLDRLRREQGLRLDEPGFEPDVMVESVARLASECADIAGRGEVEEAHAAAERTRARVLEIGSLIDASLASREATPRRLQDLEARRTAVLADVPRWQRRLDTLRATHAPAALQPASDNVDEAYAALEYAGRCLDQARTDLGDDAQRFLAARELVRRTADVLDDADALFAEIDSKERELDEVRMAAAQALRQAAAEMDLLRAIVLAPVRVLGPGTLAAANDLSSRLREQQQHHDAARPDWPAALEQAESLARGAREVLSLARKERQVYEESVALDASVRERMQKAYDLLAKSSDDRKPANKRYADAREAALHSERLRAADHPDWAEILDQLEHARALLAESERLAREDIQAADAAREAVAAAMTAVDRADRAYGGGIRAQLDAARRVLERARSALSDRDYERAMELADDAGEAARRSQRRANNVANTAAIAAALTIPHIGRGLTGLGIAAGLIAGAKPRRRRRRHYGSRDYGSGFGSSSGGSSFGR